MDYDYFATYLNKIGKKNTAQADSIKNTAETIGEKFLSKFNFCSHEMGLLVGNVQSGKTGQVFGVMCKAVELGFQYFIVLTTDNVALQQQTYERTHRDLEKGNGFVVCSENDEQKYRNHGSKPVVVVLKKNSKILKEWTNKFRNINDLKGNPLFIVDDEADASSLNTKINQHDISTINKYLKEIRDLSTSSIYLQMTGTPQAILLQSECSDWKPKPKFTYYFKPGEEYLGGDYFFPKDKAPDFVEFIENDEKGENIAYKVVIRHLVVSAQLFLTGSEVSNCLIHPSSRQDIHKQVRNDFESAIAKATFNHDSAEFQDKLKQVYDSLSPSKSAKANFNEVKDKVLDMLENRKFKIIVLNSKSSDEQDDCKLGCNFIIGGNSLGRGVTFDKLNTFYYTRSTKAPQADTMWQQSRIFGYDRDKGLISLFIPDELYNLFVQINNTNDAIIKQIEKNKKPSISYVADNNNLRPTRMNVLDKSFLNILVGNTNYFPANPINKDYDKITKTVERFKDTDKPQNVPLQLLMQLLSQFKAENFNINGYQAMMQTELNDNSSAQGMLMVRRNRNITYGKRALLSHDDWVATKCYKKFFVLTLYQVNGNNIDLKWPDHKDLWVPNIKLPGTKNFYVI